MGSRETAGQNKTNKEDTEEDEKEPTTEDELLRDREETDIVFKDNMEETVRVVSIGSEGLQDDPSLPDTPRLVTEQDKSFVGQSFIVEHCH
jgi:hypothetical protein